jgi:flagellar biosynthetic protein FliQ
MTNASAVDIVRDALMTTFWLSLPVLVAGFVAGAVVSLAQILTSIQDTTFATVPRLTVFLAALLIAMPWMLTKMIGYTETLLGNLARFAH